MKHKVYCPVCQVHFVYKEALEEGSIVVCTVCGARVEILQVKPEISSQKFAQEPQEEIRQRVDTFARLRGYGFEENKEEIIEGLLQKKEQFGDFYCPCRFDNIPENICPCLETRMNQVRKEGSCL